MHKFVIAALLASLVSVPTFAQNTKDNEEVGDPNRVICRTYHETGSRLKKERTCHTAAEWAEIRRQQRMTVDRIQSSKTTNNGG